MRSSLLIVLLLVACGQQKNDEAPTVQQLTATEFSERLTNDVVLLDVRTPDEFAGGYIPGATNLDYKSDSFGEKLDSLDKSKSYMVYCASGGRSDKATDLMAQKGFTSIAVLSGGISAWESDGLPIQRD